MARNGWSPILLWAGGAKLVVEGGENVDPSRPTIYLSNHQSTIDIPVLFRAIPGQRVPLHRQERAQVRAGARLVHAAGQVHLHRPRQPAARGESMDRAGERIRNGISIIAFPEGTRSPDGRILPFKKGPFALALKARVAVCPVTIEGSGKLMPKAKWTITPAPSV